jgi:hypothetical protein
MVGCVISRTVPMGGDGTCKHASYGSLRLCLIIATKRSAHIRSKEYLADQTAPVARI